MGYINLRINDEEMKMLESAAKHYGCTISTMIKSIVFEKLEDEYDLMVFAEYEKDKQSGNLKTRPISELWKELDL